MIEKLGEEWQTCGARTLKHFIRDEVKACGLTIFEFVEVGLDFLRGEGSLYRELHNLGGRGVGGEVFGTGIGQVRVAVGASCQRRVVVEGSEEVGEVIKLNVLVWVIPSSIGFKVM